MSQENVAIVKAAFEAWNAGDIDALRELHDPEVIARALEGWPEPGPFVGREALMRQFMQLRETWDADALELTGDFIEVADRVVQRVIWHGAGRGPESNMEMTNVFTLRKGRIFGVEYFWDHADALEAVGLSDQAMSKDNLELVREAMEAVARQDLTRLIELTDPDVEWHSFLAQLGEAGVYRGHDGMRRYVRDLSDAWEFLRTDIDDVLAVGDVVVVVGRLRYRGKGSGAETESAAGYVTKFRDGRMIYMRAFRDPDQALLAVGLG